MTEEILVNHSDRYIPLSVEFERECGRFTIQRQNKTSLIVKSFTFSDLMIVRCPQDEINGTNFAQLLENKVPLDASCARSIFSEQKHLNKLGELIKPYWWKKEFKKITVSFLGSFATDGVSIDPYIYCFKYEDPYHPPLFMTYENDPLFSSNEDLALVFKEKFIAKIQSEIKTKAKKNKAI